MTDLVWEYAAVSWAVASAVGVGALGIVGLAGGRARPRGASAFAAFAVFWAMQIVLANVAGLVTEAALAGRLLVVSTFLLFPLPFFLVEFAFAQTGKEQRNRAWQTGRVAAGVIALGGPLLLMLARPWIIEAVHVDELGVFADWGPLYAPLAIAPLFIAFGVALLTLLGVYRTAPTPRVARRYAAFVAGLGIYVGFTTGNNMAFYTGWVLEDGAHADNLPFALLFLVLTGVVAYTALELVRGRAPAGASTPAVGRRGHIIALAVTTSFLWGGVEGTLAVTALPGLDTVGLWRLAGVALVAYAITQWRVADLGRRARHHAASGVGVAGAVAGGGAAYGVAALLTANPVVAVASGLLVASAVVPPGLTTARRLLRVSRSGAASALDPELFGRRVDAYRAALEASVGRGTLEEDASFLAGLRARFGITEEQDLVLRHLAVNAVLLPRHGEADAAYERLRLLGEGGSGRTWLARDRARDSLVVLKEPLPRWQDDARVRERVLNEARTAARVRHPNVVTIHQVLEVRGGQPVLVIEYVDGGTLADHLAHDGVMPWPRACALVHGLCVGVEAVHRAGVVHRDIKPSNVLLTAEGHPKVADFGIAVAAAALAGDGLVAGTASHDAGSTQDPGPGKPGPRQRSPAGTPAYMAPEVRAGATRGDRRADVYGCGAVLHECLLGSPPGPRSTTATVDADIPQAVTRILQRALASEPDARHPTAQAMAKELASALEAHAEQTRTPGRARGSNGPRGRPPGARGATSQGGSPP